MQSIKPAISIVTVIGKGEIPSAYEALDVFTEEACQVTVSGKLRMVFGGENILGTGDQLVVQYHPDRPERRRMVIPSHFKMDHTNDNWVAQAEAAARYEETFGPYDCDSLWVKRAG